MFTVITTEREVTIYKESFYSEQHYEDVIWIHGNCIILNDITNNELDVIIDYITNSGIMSTNLQELLHRTKLETYENKLIADNLDYRNNMYCGNLKYMKDEYNLVTITEEIWNDIKVSTSNDTNLLFNKSSLCKQDWNDVLDSLDKYNEILDVSEYLFLAGGAVYSALFGTKTGDSDFFFVGDLSAEESTNIIKEVSMNNLGHNNTRTKHSYTINKEEDIQFILRSYKTKAEVLHGFDLWSCSVGYDGTNILAAPWFIYAITEGYNVFNRNSLSPSYESRLLKYTNRGMKIKVEGFKRNNVNKHAILEMSYGDIIRNKMRLLHDNFLLSLPFDVNRFFYYQHYIYNNNIVSKFVDNEYYTKGSYLLRSQIQKIDLEAEKYKLHQKIQDIESKLESKINDKYTSYFIWCNIKHGLYYLLVSELNAKYCKRWNVTRVERECSVLSDYANSTSTYPVNAIPTFTEHHTIDIQSDQIHRHNQSLYNKLRSLQFQSEMEPSYDVNMDNAYNQKIRGTNVRCNIAYTKVSGVWYFKNMIESITDIEDLINIPDNIRLHMLNSGVIVNVSYDIRYKSINPGEQTSSTFNKIVMDDIKQFFHCPPVTINSSSQLYHI